jgi:hypothetical protein
MGIAALAAAAETFRIREYARPQHWEARWLLAVAATVVAIAWSWGPRAAWTLLDVVTLDWATSLSWLTGVAAVLPVLVGVAGVVAARLRREPVALAPWLVATWAAPIVAIPMMLFTYTVLTTDAARSEWTVARQNLGFIRGDAGCGLADVLVVARQDSMRQLPLLTHRTGSGPPSLRPAPPVAGVEQFRLGSAPNESVATPWFDARAADRVGVFLFGYRSVVDKLELQWGQPGRGRIEVRGRGSIAADPAPSSAGISPWLFVPAGGLPSRPPGTDAVRFLLRSHSPSGSAIAVTSPLAYRTEPLSRALTRKGAPASALVSPAVVLYMPCAALPVLAEGSVAAPNYIVSPTVWTPDVRHPVGYATSPFAGVTDLYEVERLSVSDSTTIGPLGVWRVADTVPSGAVLEPTRRMLVDSS